jgi:hypothetical protein
MPQRHRARTEVAISRDPKVGNFGYPLLVDQDVPGFQVPVNYLVAKSVDESVEDRPTDAIMKIRPFHRFHEVRR